MLLNPSIFKWHKTPLLCVLLSIIGYYFFAYYTARTDAWQVLLLYSLLFCFTIVLLSSKELPFKFLIVISIFFRLIFLLAIPNLSQDFYRFIWDGRLVLEGINPYLHTPNSLIKENPYVVIQAKELVNGMGALSASHYSNYPPLNQLCFALAALFSKHSIWDSVIVLRLIIISADIGILYFGKKLLEALKLPSKRIWWYLLNPFIIIELTGNLHFEGVMLFFLIWSLYLLYHNKWILSAIVFACSVSIKLFPLMFLPLFLSWFAITYQTKTKVLTSKLLAITRYNAIKKFTLFYLVVNAMVIILFLPFFSPAFYNNYSQTIALWFTDFEFNASIYYLLRAIGYAITGYNEIAVIGKILAIILVIIILFFSIYRINKTILQLATSMLLVFSCYLFLSTTVHPWYLSTLVLLCIFTRFRFPIVWSFFVVLSYIAYVNNYNSDKQENLWLIGLEYLVVFAVFLYEIFVKKYHKSSSKSSGG